MSFRCLVGRHAHPYQHFFYGLARCLRCGRYGYINRAGQLI